MIRKLALLGMTGALALGISGCDDDDPIIPQTITISGTAAMGAPIVGGQVRARGANGVLSTIHLLTDDDGNYSVTAIGMNPPIIVQVEGGLYDSDGDDVPDASADNQLAMLTTATTSNVNLTPLTTLALQQAMNTSSVSAIYSSWNSTRPSSAQLADAMALIRANLDPVANALVSGWATYDFITTPFTANHLAFDQVLDTVACGASGFATTFAVSCTSGGITWDPAIDTTDFEVAEPGTGGGGGGGSTGTITVTNATPTTGNGAKVLTSATVSAATADSTRIQVEGNDFMVKVYYTTATGAVTNVSYFWGNVDFTTGFADNVAFCTGTCGATVDTNANTVVFAGSTLTSDSNTATLNGTISGLAL